MADRAKLMPTAPHASRPATFFGRRRFSKPPATDGPPAMAWVIEQQLKVGSEQEFSHLAKQITEAITKAGWPVHYTWNQVIAGTSAPTFTLVIPSNNWAGLKGPEEPFEAMLDKAMGRQGAKTLTDRLNAITVSESSTIYAYRQDLSYSP